VVERTERGGFRDLLSRDSRPVVASDDVRALLVDAGLRAARVLADVDGLAYVEGIKPRS